MTVAGGCWACLRAAQRASEEQLAQDYGRAGEDTEVDQRTRRTDGSGITDNWAQFTVN